MTIPGTTGLGAIGANSSNSQNVIQEAAHDSLWTLSQAQGAVVLRRLALLAGSEVGYHFLAGRHCLRPEDLLKSERSGEDSDKCLFLIRKALAFIKHSDKDQTMVLVYKQRSSHKVNFQLTLRKSCF